MVSRVDAFFVRDAYGQQVLAHLERFPPIEATEFFSHVNSVSFQGLSYCHALLLPVIARRLYIAMYIDVRICIHLTQCTFADCVYYGK